MQGTNAVLLQEWFCIIHNKTNYLTYFVNESSKIQTYVFFNKRFDLRLF